MNRLTTNDFRTAKNVPNITPICSSQKDQQTRDSLPIVSILTSSITKTSYIIHPSELFLFQKNIISLTKSLSCGYKYIQIIGYDYGDYYFDNKINLDIIRNYFYHTFTKKLKEMNNIDFELVLLPFENKLKKPGPIFNHMAEYAYSQLNTTYFFRINDDSEMMTPNWADSMAKMLNKKAPIYGVVGPVCNEGKNTIFTHDFTHRTHLDIFKTYYPSSLTDWWLDDWITHVYGKNYSSFDPDTQIFHSLVYGKRYEITYKNQYLLKPLVVSGRERVLQYAKKHNLPYIVDDDLSSISI